MDLRMFAACLIMTVFLIKDSDAQITGWTETGGTGAITGASGTMTVTAISDTVALDGALFTLVATPTGTDTIATYAFSTNGNPGTVGTIAAPAAGAVTATAAIGPVTTETTYVLEILATDSVGNTGTATVTLSVADLPGLDKYDVAVNLADGAAIGTAVTTLTGTNTVSTWAVSDTTNFAVTAGAVTTAVAMSASTKPGYSITVTATDGTGLTSIANIYIVVGVCSGAMKITVTAALVLMSFVSAYLI